MKEYKVLTQKDEFFSGKFDSKKLELALNSYASDGWELNSTATADVPAFSGSRQEIVFILERNKQS